MQTYFKNNFVGLYYDNEAHIGKGVWQGNLQGPELREAYIMVVEIIDRFSLTGWLTDDRLMQPFTPADMEWTMEVHVPRMAASSLMRFARLPSNFEKNRASVDLMIDKGLGFDTGLQVRDFADEQEALDWLKQSH